MPVYRVSGSRGHAGTGAGALWDFGARRGPVEGLQHGHVVPTRGAHLFPPQPLLHALKHISKDIIKAASFFFQPGRMIVCYIAAGARRSFPIRRQ